MRYPILLLCFFFAACTENARVKNYGGTGEINLDPGEKLVNVTWKDTDMWILTKKMLPSDSAEVYFFKENSSLGVWEGTFIINERKATK